MENEIEVWYSEYELRQFIHIATRWSIDKVYKNRTKEQPFTIFTESIKNARVNFELFAKQLNKKLTKNEHWKAIQIDLEDKFLRMLNYYINWYYENLTEIKKFDPYNPYELMLSIIESTKKEILKYFPVTIPIIHNDFDIQKIKTEIEKQESVNAKLNYWHNILIKYIDEPILKMNTKDQSEDEIAKLRHNLQTQLFNDCYNIPLFPITKSIYNQYFKGELDNPEFTYWFLKYNAKKYFETVYDIKSLESKLRSPTAKQHITAELKRLTDFEDNANNLLLNNKVDIYSTHHNTKYTKEIELLRIKGDYYEKHVLPFVHSTNATTILYADHIYLKDCLTTSTQVANIGFNKAVISEYTSNKVYELNHIKIGTLDTVEGFFIYLSTIERAEDFFINSNLDLDNNPDRNIFEEYFQKAFADHLKKTKTLFRLNEMDFKEHLYSKEVDNLLIFKKYISYFIFEETIQFMLLKKNDEFLDWLKPQTQEIDSNKALQGISFTKNNYEIVIRDWNKKNNNNLSKWLKSGQMVKIEEWNFISKERLIKQEQVLKDLYGLIDMVIINNANLHDQIMHMCKNNAHYIKNTIDDYFASAIGIQITLPFVSLCPKIIEQPLYLIEAHLKYNDNLSDEQKIYYRYDYLMNKIGFGKDKFIEYKHNLNSSIRFETLNKNKDIINSMFLFIEQFIDDLNSMHRTQFNYIASPLFRLLFEEIIRAKDYYIAVFGNFTFKNILKIENALKTLEPIAIDDIQTTNKLTIKEEKEIITKSKPKYAAKYYALYHWILIEMGKAKLWELNENGKFPKSEIEQYAQSQYLFKDGQGFYRAFIGINDFNNKIAIVRSLNDKNYKEKLKTISNNNANFIHHIKNYPT